MLLTRSVTLFEVSLTTLKTVRLPSKFSLAGVEERLSNIHLK
jgi:hypothetical protein